MRIDDVKELAACKALIEKTNLPLITFVREAMRGWSEGFEKKRAREVVKEYQAKQVGRSKKFTDDIRWRLTAFTDKFGSQFIDTIRGPEVREWIEGRTFKGQAVSSRTKTNYLKMLRGLWRFSQKRQWISAGTHQLSLIDGWVHDAAAYSAMPSSELSHLLDLCNNHVGRDQLVPYLALQAWGGLRAAEAGRMNWEEITVRNGRVVGLTVSASKSKTKARRVIDATPALAAMLHEWAVIRQLTGPIQKWTKLPHILRKIQKKPYKPEFDAALDSGVAWEDEAEFLRKFVWRHNQLRHTCATHLLREWGSAEKVSEYLGTSPSMLDSHYRELTTPDETDRWMGMRPLWSMPAPLPHDALCVLHRAHEPDARAHSDDQRPASGPFWIQGLLHHRDVRGDPFGARGRLCAFSEEDRCRPWRCRGCHADRRVIVRPGP